MGRGSGRERVEGFEDAAIRFAVEDKLKPKADPNGGQLVILKSDQLAAAPTAVTS